MLLARLYMNAEVYTGTADWANAKLYAKKVIDSPYKLYTTKKGQWSAYQQLFMGDNGEMVLLLRLSSQSFRMV